MPAARWPHLAHLFGAGFARGLERAKSLFLSLSLFFSASLPPSEQDSGLMASRPYFVVCHPRSHAVTKYLLGRRNWLVNGQDGVVLPDGDF